MKSAPPQRFYDETTQKLKQVNTFASSLFGTYFPTFRFRPALGELFLVYIFQVLQTQPNAHTTHWYTPPPFFITPLQTALVWYHPGCGMTDEPSSQATPCSWRQLSSRHLPIVEVWKRLLI